MFFPFHDDNPTTRTPAITYALIAANVLSFLNLQRLPGSARQDLIVHWGFMPARIGQAIDPNPRPLAVTIPALARDPWGRQAVVAREVLLPPAPQQVLWSLLTCMFLHGGWWHLIGNMWFLWIFGNNVEDRLGMFPYLLLYLFGGLLASAAHWLVEPSSTTPVIGASGAVATVLGAYAITWPWARIHTFVVLIVFVTIIDLPAMLVLGAWFFIQLLSGSAALEQGAAGGVAWWAHVGGFLAGLLLMPLFNAVFGPERHAAPHAFPLDEVS